MAKKRGLARLTGAFLGTTALTVAMTVAAQAADVETDSALAAATVVFDLAVNEKVGTAQTNGADIVGLITGSTVDVTVVGAYAGDAIASNSAISVDSAGNVADFSIAGGAPGARRAIGSGQLNTEDVTSTLTGAFTGVSVTGSIIDPATVTVEGNLQQVVSTVNDSTVDIAASGAFSGTLDAPATDLTGNAADATGEIAAAISQHSIDTAPASGIDTEAVLGGTDPTDVNMIGLELGDATPMSNPAGATISGNTGQAIAQGNVASLTATEAVTGTDIDVALATNQTVDSTAVVRAEGFQNRVGIHGAAGANIDGTGLGGPVNITIADNSTNLVSSVNTATHNVTAGPGDAASQVVSDISQSGGVGRARFRDTSHGVELEDGAITGANITISGSTMAGQATNNEATQNLTLTGGVVAGTVATTTTQNTGAGDITEVSPAIGEMRIGVRTGGNAITSTDLTISGNAITGTAIGNRATDNLADITGNITAGVGQTITQGSDGAAVQALVNDDGDDIVIGIDDATEFNDGNLLISNNNIGASATGSAAVQNRGDLTGAVSATVSQTVAQTSRNITSLRAAVSDAVFGPDGTSDTNLARNTGDVDLTVSGNAVSAQADVNAVSRTLGTVTGTVTGADVVASTTQANTTIGGAAVAAQLSGLSFGAGSEGSNTGSFGSFANNSTDVTITNNSATAGMRGNVAITTSEPVLGGLADFATGGADGGSITVLEDQNNTATTLLAEISDGVTSHGVAIGIIGQTSSILNFDEPYSIIVSSNQVGTQVEGNVAATALGSITGTFTDGGVANFEGVGARHRQFNGGDSSFSAQTSDVDIGGTGSHFILGDNMGADATMLVEGNDISASATANNSQISLAGFTGTLSDNYAIGRPQITPDVSIAPNTTLAQTTASSSISASTANSSIGVHDVTGIAADERTDITVGGNTISALATGNAARYSFGAFNGTLNGGGDHIFGAYQANSNVDVLATLNPVATDRLRIGVNNNSNYFAGRFPATGLIRGNMAVAQAIGNTNTLRLDSFTGNASGAGTEALFFRSVQWTNDTFGASTVIATADQLTLGINDTRTIASNFGGSAEIVVADNVFGAVSLMNVSDQSVGAITAATIEDGARIYLGTEHREWAPFGTPVLGTASLSNSRLGVNNVRDIANFFTARAQITISNNVARATAVGGSASLIVEEFNGTLASTGPAGPPDSAGIHLNHFNDANTAQFTAMINMVQIGLQPVTGGIANQTNTSANFAITGNQVLATAGADRATLGLFTNGFTGTLSGSALFEVEQRFIGSSQSTATIQNTTTGLAVENFVADGNSSIVNLTVAGNSHVATAGANDATLILGDITGTLSGSISLDTMVRNQLQSHAATTITSQVIDSGIGFSAASFLAQGAGARLGVVVTNNRQVATVTVNNMAIAAGAIVGGVSGSITLRDEQLLAGDSTATINNADTGVRVFHPTNTRFGTDDNRPTVDVSGNITQAALTANRSVTRVEELVMAGQGNVSLGATQNMVVDSNNGGTPDISAVVTNSVETGIDIFAPPVRTLNVDGIVANNNTSADVAGNVAISAVLDLGGVLSAPGSVVVEDVQTIGAGTISSSVDRAFTQIDLDSGGTIIGSAILNENRIGSSAVGNAQMADIATSGLSVGGVIGISGSQSNAAPVSSSVSGSAIGTELRAGTSINNTNIVRGSGITSRAIGNSAVGFIR